VQKTLQEVLETWLTRLQKEVEKSEFMTSLLEKNSLFSFTPPQKIPDVPKKMIPKEAFKGLEAAKNLAQLIDHTLLKADAIDSEFKLLCEEAIEYGFYSVCVNASKLNLVVPLLKDSNVKPIAVIGFPLGCSTSLSKAFETKDAVSKGAQEIDMVLNIGALKSGSFSLVQDDIQAVVEAAKPFPVKVILETAALTDEQKTIACALSKSAGAAFVKTSTGFGKGGATKEDIALMRKVVGENLGVKASGGIRTLSDALTMIEAGANRIGASSSVAIIKELSDPSAKNKSSGGY
jgi:deoxyribose-phosphate aldolase